jgi:metal-sulfur cluster biosynthetic enzyme
MVTEAKVVKELKKIIDPHTNINVYDMGLIKDLAVKEGDVSLTFVPSSPFCPLGVQLAFAIKDKLEEHEEIDKVDMKVEGHVQQEQLNEMLKKGRTLQKD